MHDHHWRVRVVVRASELDRTGWVLDFHDVDAAMARVVEPYVGRFLNDVPPFDDVNPTRENSGAGARDTPRGGARRRPGARAPGRRLRGRAPGELHRRVGGAVRGRARLARGVARSAGQRARAAQDDLALRGGGLEHGAAAVGGARADRAVGEEQRVRRAGAGQSRALGHDVDEGRVRRGRRDRRSRAARQRAATTPEGSRPRAPLEARARLRRAATRDSSSAAAARTSSLASPVSAARAAAPPRTARPRAPGPRGRSRARRGAGPRRAGRAAAAASARAGARRDAADGGGRVQGRVAVLRRARRPCSRGRSAASPAVPSDHAACARTAASRIARAARAASRAPSRRRGGPRASWPPPGDRRARRVRASAASAFTADAERRPPERLDDGVALRPRRQLERAPAGARPPRRSARARARPRAP